MANPNIVSVATIEGGSLGHHLLVADTAVMTVTAEYIIKINSILIANVDGTNAATCDVRVLKANYVPLGITDTAVAGTFYIAKTVNVPADDVLVLVDTPFYLQEGDVLQGRASVALDLDMFISYEVIID
jgi:hypothetical protein